MREKGQTIKEIQSETKTELSITPMIDVTFLLLVFFLVCSKVATQDAVDLPPARYGPTR